MILELLLKLVFGLFDMIINLIPDMSAIDPLSEFTADFAGFIDLLAMGFVIFPYQLFLIFIGNVLFWLSAQMIWAIIEWVYIKIPGVN